MTDENLKNENHPAMVEPAAGTLEDSRGEQTPVRKPLAKRTKVWIGIAVAVLFIFFTPWRINVLLLGIDPTHDDTAQGRSDTMILTSIPPLLPTSHMLSIPRDLYVDIPGHGQNRINTAHFFAEVAETGTGPRAAAQAVALNFKIPEPYTVRIQIGGFQKVVDAMGGVDVYLPADMSGLDAGAHHLDATQALRFVRDRTGSDDFFRQERAQIFLKGATLQMLRPANWGRIPAVVSAINDALDTNVPFFYWPRISYSLLFSAVRGFDMQSLDRYTMTTPWVTEGGGQVLLPNWETIDPFMNKYFK
jgi:LCP family protein required for cell wall assembly